MGVGRVIARPFTGNEHTGFERTKNRKDFSLPPPGLTILNLLQNAGVSDFAQSEVSDSGFKMSEVGIHIMT